jgi:hypothetical protein
MIAVLFRSGKLCKRLMVLTRNFRDRSFDLVLSGHFIFTYGHKFEYSFILSSIIELFRVCSREVRIYPLQKLSSEPYEHMTELLCTLKNQYGITYDIVRPI